MTPTTTPATTANNQHAVVVVVCAGITVDDDDDDDDGYGDAEMCDVMTMIIISECSCFSPLFITRSPLCCLQTRELCGNFSVARDARERIVGISVFVCVLW